MLLERRVNGINFESTQIARLQCFRNQKSIIKVFIENENLAMRAMRTES